jgi:RND family efflux transporter MFP subunit
LELVEEAPDLQRLKIDRSAAPRGRRSALPWILLLIVIGAGGFFGWRGGWFAQAMGSVIVELGRVQRVGGAQAQSGVAANGYVVARTQASLSTDMQGRLVEMPVEEGMRVTKGQLIARLDTTQLEATLERSRQSVLVSSAEVARAEQDLLRFKAEAERAASVLHLAELDEARMRTLVASGSERQAMLDAAHAALTEAQASRRAADAAVASQAAGVTSNQAAVLAAKSAVREVEVMIEKSTVRAPFDGVITRKNAEVGEVVSAIGATGPNARGAVATLVDFSTLEVQVELAQASLGAARDGAEVRIYLDAYPERAYAGRVRQIWPTADRQKATVELRVEFLERDEKILPEMSVRVIFVPSGGAAERPVEVLVPSRALVRGADVAVFLFAEGRVERRIVTIAEERSDGMARVASGLTGNEMVVLDPPAGLQDGDGVKRKEA